MAPDELVSDLRFSFPQLGIKNDIFGVRDAEGLEFASVCIIGFFSHFESLRCRRPWENVLCWLFSTEGITTTESTEKIQGKVLDNCDNDLSHPEIEDQAMMLYTAITRARAHLYVVEVEGLGTNGDRKKTKNGTSLDEFAFRQLKDLRLLKVVTSIDEGEIDMTPQQHKARGVLIVVQAITMGRSAANAEAVRKKFGEAAERFQPDRGNDQHLLEQCNKHLQVFGMKQSLKEQVKTKFFRNGAYDLNGGFRAILKFEEDAIKFSQLCANDSFLIDEVQEIRLLIQELFSGTPYEGRFSQICNRVKTMETDRKSVV